jgi:hypothetical protein
VRITSNCIPNVYAMADDAVYNAATRELTVSVFKAHGFAVGDIVRIITADAGNVDKPVRAIFNDDTFELWGVEKPSRQACVLGKRVDDFRVVDQPFTRNLGATRQLVAENQALKARIAALEQAVASLQKQK